MRRGTRVGEAYVALTADGTGLNEDIVESVDEAGPGVEKAGKEHGKDYSDEFGRSLEERLEPMMDRLGKEMGERLSKQVGNSLKSSFSSSSQKSIVGRLGEALADRVESSMAEVEDRIAAAVKNASGGGSGGGGGRGAGPGSPMFPSQGPDPDRDRAVWEMAQRMNEKFDRDRTVLLARAASADAAFDKQRTVMLDQAHKMNEKFAKDQGLMMDRAYADNEKYDRARTLMLTRAHALNERFDQQRQDNIMREGRLLERAYEMNDKYDRDRTRMINRAYEDNDRYDRARTKMLAEAHRLNIQFEKGRLGGDGRSVSGNSGGGSDSGGIGDSIGKFLGAGSRNNFLNIIGKTIGNTIGLVEKGVKVAGDLFTTFRTGFAEAESGFLGLGKVAGGFGAAGSKAFAGLAASAPALIAAIAAIGLALSAVVSVVSALIALAVALAAALATALTGAAIIAAGALGAIVVSAGLLVAAFTSLTDAQKSLLKADFQPLKAEVTGLGQAVLNDLLPYLHQIAPLLQNALGLLAPLANEIGSAFGQAGVSIAAALSGPGFQMLSASLAVYLPMIVANLGRAIGSLLDGLAGTFSAILPYVTRFSAYLADVAARFDAFASSAQGQNSIADFMDRAVVSIKSVFSFLRELGGLITDVLFSADAQNAGNSLFDSLANSFKGFRENVQKAIADGSFKKWFDDAIKFGGDLKDAIISIKDAFVALNNSGVLAAVGDAIKVLAALVEGLASGIGTTVDAINNLAKIRIPNNPLAIGEYSYGGRSISDAVSGKPPAGSSGLDLGGILNDTAVAYGGAQASADFVGPTIAESKTAAAAAAAAAKAAGTAAAAAQSMIESGNKALDATSTKSGGNLKKPKYVNPYIAMANKLIQEAPSVAAQMKNAILTVNKQVVASVRDAANSTDYAAVQNTFTDLAQSIRTGAQEAINSAKDGVSSAAQSLAGATTKAGVKTALADLKLAQEKLVAAQGNQKKIQAVAKLLADQKIVTESSVVNMVAGIKSQYYTLAEYAEGRSRVAALLEKANQKLTDAIALRDDYDTAVTEAAKSFGSLLTAQAKNIDGIQQALTATDITTNLQDRLDKMLHFQEDLRKLLALGLNNDAYKQLVDAGVEQGSAYADALLAGGQGAVGQVNTLTDQISATAAALGETASNRLYQAGVDAAQGLVDGLNSLSAELDSAAAALGEAIASAVKRSLGIASPSKVMRRLMGPVGDGLELGLNDQSAQVERAANRLSSKVTVAPSAEVARYAAAQSRVEAGVSGNSAPMFAEGAIRIETPTKDPKAVAIETVNELTGRLG